MFQGFVKNQFGQLYNEFNSGNFNRIFRKYYLNIRYSNLI